MRITATLYRVRMKLSAPFGHARAVRDESDNIVLVLDFDGTTGIGESVPRDYVTGETPAGALDAIRALDLPAAAAAACLSTHDLAAGVTAIEQLQLAAQLRRGERPALAAACAVELALLDILGKRCAKPLADVAPALRLRDSLPPAHEPRRLPASRAIDLLATASDLTRAGDAPDHVKIKGGAEASADALRARAVRDVFGDRVTLSFDANMSWSLDEATRRFELLRPYDVTWYEEPLRQYAWQDYATLRARTGARIMLDESLCSFDDGRRAIEAGACDLFNIRISKNGGLLSSLRLAQLAHQHGLELQLGIHPGQMGVLGAAGAHFLRVVPDVAAVEGGGDLIGIGRLPEKIIREDLRLDHDTGQCHGLLPTGLGVTPDTAAIERHAVTRATWRDGRWTEG